MPASCPGHLPAATRLRAGAATQRWRPGPPANSPPARPPTGCCWKSPAACAAPCPARRTCSASSGGPGTQAARRPAGGGPLAPAARRPGAAGRHARAARRPPAGRRRRLLRQPRARTAGARARCPRAVRGHRRARALHAAAVPRLGRGRLEPPLPEPPGQGAADRRLPLVRERRGRRGSGLGHRHRVHDAAAMRPTTRRGATGCCAHAPRGARAPGLQAATESLAWGPATTSFDLDDVFALAGAREQQRRTAAGRGCPRLRGTGRGAPGGAAAASRAAPPGMQRLRLGTRGSPLAMAQSRLVAAALAAPAPGPDRRARHRHHPG